MKTLLLHRTGMVTAMAAAMRLLFGTATPMNLVELMAHPKLLAGLAVVALIVLVLVPVIDFAPRSHLELATTPSQGVLFIQ